MCYLLLMTVLSNMTLVTSPDIMRSCMCNLPHDFATIGLNMFYSSQDMIKDQAERKAM